MCERFDRLDREAIGPEPRITVGKGTVDALVATVLCLRALSFLSPLLRSFVDPGLLALHCGGATPSFLIGLKRGLCGRAGTGCLGSSRCIS